LHELLNDKSFVRFWFSKIAANTAAQMLMVALAWQMYDLTGSAWDLGLVGLYQFFPALVLTLWAGHVADRLPREKIVTVCWFIQSLVVLVIFLAIHQNALTRSFLLGVSLVLGVVRAFQNPAQQALLPSLVKSHVLTRAMALNSMGYQTSVVAGPALGGLLYALHAQSVYGVCWVLFTLSSFWFLGIKTQAQKRVEQVATLESVLAGVVYVWRKKIILGSISLDLFAVLLGGATALLPIYAKDIFHTGPWGLGVLRAAPALGAIAASLVLARWPLRHRVGKKLLISVGVFGLSIMAFAISKLFWLSFLALMISGMADMVSVVIRHTLVQIDTPAEMRGRVSAVNMVFVGASNQLGEFESGATAAWFGPVGAAFLGGMGTLVVALTWAYLFKDLFKRDQMSAPQAL
jgi:MFS family permease